MPGALLLHSNPEAMRGYLVFVLIALSMAQGDSFAGHWVGLQRLIVGLGFHWRSFYDYHPTMARMAPTAI